MMESIWTVYRWGNLTKDTIGECQVLHTSGELSVEAS